MAMSVTVENGSICIMTVDDGGVIIVGLTVYDNTDGSMTVRMGAVKFECYIYRNEKVLTINKEDS